MKVFTPIKEDDHWCCPTCGKHAKEPKIDDVDVKRGRPIFTEDRYEIWIKEADKEFTGKYGSLYQGENDLIKKGFSVNVNKLFSCLRGKYHYKNLRIKQLVPHEELTYKVGRHQFTEDKYEIWIKQGDQEFSGKFPSMNKAVDHLSLLGFKLSRQKISNTLHKKVKNKQFSVSLIKSE